MIIEKCKDIKALVAFDHEVFPIDEEADAYVASVASQDLSVEIHDENGKILGYYILGAGQIIDAVEESCWRENLSRYTDKKGVEGVSVWLDPSLRGIGIGKTLIEYPKSLGFDYIWGWAAKDLGNLKDWLKRRRLVAEDEDSYVTLEDYK